jgi:hypothetical protein
MDLQPPGDAQIAFAAERGQNNPATQRHLLGGALRLCPFLKQGLIPGIHLELFLHGSTVP